MRRTVPMDEARKLYVQGWGWAEISRILAEKHKPAFRPETIRSSLRWTNARDLRQAALRKSK